MATTGDRGITKVEFSPLLPLILAVCRRAEPLVPAGITPNQITAASFVGVLGSSTSMYLASFNQWWFVGVVGLYFAHWFFDNLDGTLARARGLTSERGFFLDLFLDVLGYSAFFLAVALSRYSHGFTLITLLVLVLIRELLMLDWMLLRQRFVMPLIGPSELPLIILLLALLTVFWPREVFRVGGVGFTWMDTAATLASISYVIDIIISAVRLYRGLKPAGA